ncbi:MAG: mechanosensitive ion channel family protein [Pseudomonadales bacterium]
MNEKIEQLISLLPISFTQQGVAGVFAALATIAFLALCAHFLGRVVLLRLVEKLLSSRNTKRDDLFVRRHVFRRLVHIIPALVIYSLAAPMLPDYPQLASFLEKCSMLYMIIMIVLFVDALLNVMLDIYRSFEISKHFPIKSFIQAIKLISYFVAVIALISMVVGESPLQLIAGLGAMTAVLMLVFKDPILGFVAGLQLSSNRMVSIGDWIEMPKHGVDGDVLEIALTTVKVRNFDNTITTVPTQALINDSFKNWAGMQRSGGRRIKRSVSIDLSSVKFCDASMLERFAKIQHINEYIQTKQREVDEFNSGQQIDLASSANGRRLTNLGTFRAYIQAYLRHHSQISQDLTFLVRQLKPTETGVPIEIYVFSTEKRWVQYEAIQADIFDHIIAVIPEFDLQLFQNPSGSDFRTALPRSA